MVCNNRLAVVSSAVIGMALGMLWLGSQAMAGVTMCVSVTPEGVEGYGASCYPSISADGRFVAFQSNGENIVPGTLKSVGSIYVRDRQMSHTTCLCVTPDGSPADGPSEFPSISSDGLFVAFQSEAKNLLPPGITSFGPEVFVHDRLTGKATWVCSGPDGKPAVGGARRPCISGDGRWVVFEVMPAQGREQADALDVVFYSRQTNQRVAIPVGVKGGPNHRTRPTRFLQMSGDGRYLAFISSLPDLVPGRTILLPQVYLYDLRTARVWCLSDGVSGFWASEWDCPSISDDGRFVAFVAGSTDKVQGRPLPSVREVYVFDRLTSQTTCISGCYDGPTSDKEIVVASLSGDGRFVAFECHPMNIGYNQESAERYIYLYDREAGQPTRIPAGPRNMYSAWCAKQHPSLSRDGRFIAFCGLNSENQKGQRPAGTQVYVHDRLASPPPPRPTPAPTPTPIPRSIIDVW